LSEWLLLGPKWVNFTAILWWEQASFTWDNDDVCCVLDHENKLALHEIMMMSAVY
jgi:hypothetical protein